MSQLAKQEATALRNALVVASNWLDDSTPDRVWSQIRTALYGAAPKMPAPACEECGGAGKMMVGTVECWCPLCRPGGPFLPPDSAGAAA